MEVWDPNEIVRVTNPNFGRRQAAHEEYDHDPVQATHAHSAHAQVGGRKKGRHRLRRFCPTSITNNKATAPAIDKENFDNEDLTRELHAVSNEAAQAGPAPTEAANEDQAGDAAAQSTNDLVHALVAEDYVQAFHVPVGGRR